MSAVMRNFRRYQLRKASTEAVAREVLNTIPLVLKPSEKWILKRLARRLDPRRLLPLHHRLEAVHHDES